MFTPNFSVAKNAMRNSRMFRRPGKADVSAKMIHRAIKLGDSLIIRLEKWVGIPRETLLLNRGNRRIVAQLIRKANRHLLNMSNISIESYVKDNPKLARKFDSIFSGLKRVIDAIKV